MGAAAEARFRPIPHTHAFPSKRSPQAMNASFLYIASPDGLKAYRVEGDTPRLVDYFPIDSARDRWRDPPVDRAGTPPAESATERLRHEAETDLRLLRKITGRLLSLLDESPDARWTFAAPAEINAAILDGLPARYRTRLAQNLREDLFHTPEEKLDLRLDLSAVPNP